MSNFHRINATALALGVVVVVLATGASTAVATPGDAALSAPEAQKIIHRYLADRAGIVTGQRVTQENGSAGARSLTTIPTTAALQHRLNGEAGKLDKVRIQALNTPSRGFTKAAVDVTVDSLTPGAPAEVKVSATETTKLYFGHGDPDAPQFEGYRLRHEFTFVDHDGRWTLAATTPRLGAGPPPPTQAGVSAPQPTRTGEDLLPQAPNRLPSARVITAKEAGARAPAGAIDKLSGAAASSVEALAYDYAAMWQYAAEYWDSYNPAYRAFSNDCTNFISQIMEAGGWTYDLGFYWDDSNWWYNSLNQTYSWAGAHNWGVFAQVISHRTVPLEYVYQMFVTDVLQVDWDHPDEVPGEAEGNIDHTMFVSGHMGTPGAATEIYLSYHSNDRWNVPFWGELLPGVDARDVWYAHRT